MTRTARQLSCLLSLFLCCPVFSQTVSLPQLQAQAKSQIQQHPWLESRHVWAVCAAAGAGAGTAWFIQNARAQRLLESKTAEKELLTRQLENARYEIRSLRDWGKGLVKQRDSALELFEKSEAMRLRAQPKTLLPPRSVTPPSGPAYMYLTHTPLSKEFLASSPSNLALLSEGEIRSFVQNLDRAASRPPVNARAFLHTLARSSSEPALTQLYIQAARYVKILAGGALILSLLPQDVQARKRQDRLEENPALFFEASEQQLLEWQSDPQADALCRETAQAVNRLAGLNLSEREGAEAVQKAEALLRAPAVRPRMRAR